MKKPIHATPDAPILNVTVFEKGKRNIAFQTQGADPSKLVKQVSDKLPEAEKKTARPAIRKALKSIIETPIPGMTTCQIDVGGRRLRFAPLIAA